MAQTLTIRAEVNNQTDGSSAGSSTYPVTTTGDNAWENKAPVATTEEQWTISSGVVNAGACIIRNFSTANFVDVGFATGVYPIRIKAGNTDKISLTPATSSLFLKADTASCTVQVRVWEA